MMGVERGNLDLLVLALVGSAALIYDENNRLRFVGNVAFISLGVILKLFPIFCLTVGSRCTKRALLLAGLTAAVSFAYLMIIWDYIPLIRRNVPTTFVLSYGYKAIFLYLDHLPTEVGLSPMKLADGSLPATATALTILLAALLALMRANRPTCRIDGGVTGASFLFGAGIYCGTFLLGTNFIYRLMFLLLCVPQLLDWQKCEHPGCGSIERVSFGIVLATLWLNANSNGHATFWLMPYLIEWLLFFGLALIIMSNFLINATSRSVS
jgi:hypothetical protein